MEGAFGVTIALIDIEPCETERRCSRSQVDSGGPAPVPEWEKVCSIVAWDALLRHCEITQARASTPIPLRSVRPSLTQEATTDATPPCCIPASTVMRARSRLRPSSPVSPPNPSAHSSTLYPPTPQPPHSSHASLLNGLSLSTSSSVRLSLHRAYRVLVGILSQEGRYAFPERRNWAAGGGSWKMARNTEERSSNWRCWRITCIRREYGLIAFASHALSASLRGLKYVTRFSHSLTIQRIRLGNADVHTVVTLMDEIRLFRRLPMEPRFVLIIGNRSKTSSRLRLRS